MRRRLFALPSRTSAALPASGPARACPERRLRSVAGSGAGGTGDLIARAAVRGLSAAPFQPTPFHRSAATRPLVEDVS